MKDKLKISESFTVKPKKKQNKAENNNIETERLKLEPACGDGTQKQRQREVDQ